jgi:putative YhbY family RNA-binding protein
MRARSYTRAMHELTATQKKALKARAHALHPILQLGGKGLTDAVVAEIERALAHHELIKVRAAPLNRDEREVALASICERTGAQAVQHIGKMLVLYREKPPQEPPQDARRAAPARDARPAGASAATRTSRRGSRTSSGRPGSAPRPRRRPPSR